MIIKKVNQKRVITVYPLFLGFLLQVIISQQFNLSSQMEFYHYSSNLLLRPLVKFFVFSLLKLALAMKISIFFQHLRFSLFFIASITILKFRSLLCQQATISVELEAFLSFLFCLTIYLPLPFILFLFSFVFMLSYQNQF